MWSTEDLLVQYDRGILVWHHRLNHCIFKYLLRIFKRLIISRKIRKVIKLPRVDECLFGKSHKRPCSNKGKHAGESIRNPS